MTAVRKIRNCIAAATGAIPIASFVTLIWLFFSYFSSHPHAPQPDQGLVHALNNHGSYAFISDSESTGMALLMIAFLVGFALTVAIVPKEFVLPPANSPRWLTYVSGRAKIDPPSVETQTIMLISLFACFAMIWFAGSAIVDFAVSHGIVLNFL